MNSTRRRSEHAPRHTRDPLIGVKIADEFQILRGVGSGSHADVFIATQASVGGRHVALKVLCQPYLRLKEADFRRAQNTLLREGKLLGALRSPCFAEVYRTGTTEDERPYIAMEYVHGPTLADAHKDGPLERNLVVEVLKQLADGLSELHAMGYVHRDITPSNILLHTSLSGRTQVKLIDLGTVTKVSDRADKYRVGYDLEHPLGTPAYMSPEQAKGNVVDGRADQFALAACIYQCLSGKRPFSAEGHGAKALLERLKSDATIPESPSAEIEANLGLAARALDKALSNDPAQRFDSVMEFSEVFSREATAKQNPNSGWIQRLLKLGGHR